MDRRRGGGNALAETRPAGPAPAGTAPAVTGDDPGEARRLMERFRGDGDGDGSRRYLWTDAFAVCNWLGLGEVERATALVDRVHRVLGRHRPDDARQGWISGLAEAEGARRPTAGGLRIGKPLPERRPDEPYDPRLEWERDGQYFHYLTRWIRALRAVAGVTGEGRYRRWAVELALVAYQRFHHGTGAVPAGLYWKMSIDLSRPLVPSMGQHDALDGYVVMSALEPAAGPDGERGRDGEGEARLKEARAGLAELAGATAWATDDPLGAGSLLTGAWFLARSGRRVDPVMLDRVVEAAAVSVEAVRRRAFSDRPTARLAFRELGLALGMAAVDRLPDLVGGREGPAGHLRTLTRARPLRDQILGFWTTPSHQGARAWREHEDINTVMLATALAPEGYLDSP